MCEEYIEPVAYKVRATIPSATMKIIGSRLKEAREIAGLAQTQAAFMLLIEPDLLVDILPALKGTGIPYC